MSAIEVSRDLRCRFGPSRDQGPRPTCLAFAISDTHAAAIGLPWSPLSCEYLYYHAKQRDLTPPDDGAAVGAIQDALEHDGQPRETEWPYLPSMPSDLDEWRPPSNIADLFRRKSKLDHVKFDDIWNAIEGERPFLLGMTLSDAFFCPDEDGVVDVDEPQNPAMRHAVVAVATGTLVNRRLLLVRNSWGESWGLSGHAWLSERYLVPRIELTIAIN